MEALENSKKSVKLVHQLFKDLLSLCGVYIKKIESRDPKLRRVLQNLKPNAKGSENAAENNQGLGQSERQQISILSTSPS